LAQPGRSENRTRKFGLGGGLTLALVAAGLAPMPSLAQPPAEQTPIQAIGSHRVSSIVFRFVRDNPGLPAPEALLAASVELTSTPGGWSAAEPGQAAQRMTLADLVAQPEPRLTDTGLAAVAPAAVQRMKDLGYVGVYVVPDPTQFHVSDGVVVDTRPAGDTSLVLEVTTGVVTEVRTIAVGERVEPGESLNNPLHDRIRRRSPVAPHAQGDPARRDLLLRTKLDAYTARLNRQPGRRVDVAVSAPGDQPGSVTLDYMITENRPWLIFGQVSNTGSGSTDALREHFGFIHNDLSNNDDILTLGYQTANFDDVHQVYGSYDRPLYDSERWRWRVHGAYYRYVASEVGFPDLDFRGEGWNAGGELAWNFFQRGDLFLDAIAGVRFEHIRVDNELTGLEGEQDFLIPRLALRLQQSRDASRTDATIGLEFNLPGVAGTGENLDPLGRVGAVRDFTILRGEATHAFYLDPYLDDQATRTGNLVHEVLLAAKGQHALGNRLYPNEEQVAGGLYTVRGYPVAQVAGDNVVIGTIEYRVHLPRAVDPEVQPGTLFGQPFRWKPQYAYGPTDWDLVFKVFIDAARVTNSDRMSFEVDDTLVGAGVGAEFSLTRRLNLRADLGFALLELQDAAGGNTVDAGHAELHLVLTLIY
jgi:hemolysin activation/secretion protein